MIVYAIRYFLAIGIHSTPVLTVLMAIVAVGVWTIALDPTAIDSGLGMVLFVQMFLASSGFAPRARQGHFDALIAAVRRRSDVALAHAIVSIAPGVAAWLVLAGIAAILGSPAAASALAGSRAAALLIVSLVAWSAGFLLTRGAAGIGWIAALLGLLLGHVDVLRPSSAAPGALASVVLQALTILGCPFLLIGTRPPVRAGSIAAAAVIAVALAASTVRATRRLDIYLADHA
jgi:hypothetical protein